MLLFRLLMGKKTLKGWRTRPDCRMEFIVQMHAIESQGIHNLLQHSQTCGKHELISQSVIACIRRWQSCSVDEVKKLQLGENVNDFRATKSKFHAISRLLHNGEGMWRANVSVKTWVRVVSPTWKHRRVKKPRRSRVFQELQSVLNWKE